MRAVVVLVAAAAVSFGASGEDSIRCRNGRIVNVGMTDTDVSSRCGQPTSRRETGRRSRFHAVQRRDHWCQGPHPVVS